MARPAETRAAEQPKQRPQRPAKAEPPRAAQKPAARGGQSPSGGRGAGQRGRTGRPARDEDPGLVLISRRPPQQKFSSFDAYMEAHGGATAPIEDHTNDFE